MNISGIVCALVGALGRPPDFRPGNGRRPSVSLALKVDGAGWVRVSMAGPGSEQLRRLEPGSRVYVEGTLVLVEDGARTHLAVTATRVTPLDGIVHRARPVAPPAEPRKSARKAAAKTPRKARRPRVQRAPKRPRMVRSEPAADQANGRPIDWRVGDELPA